MRHTHWWGAAAGVGMLAVAAAGAPAAFAAHGQHTPAVKAVAKPVAQPVAQHPVKIVVRVPAAPARVVVKHRNGDGDGDGYGNGHGDDHNGHHHPGCAYPPHGWPDVSIDGASKVKKNVAFSLTGTVKVNGCGYENQQAVLYKFVDGGRHHSYWIRVGQPAMTDTAGAVRFDNVTAERTTSYRIFSVPSDGLASGQSGEHVVKVTYRDHDDHVRGH